jgi:hypothetical protein
MGDMQCPTAIHVPMGKYCRGFPAYHAGDVESRMGGNGFPVVSLFLSTGERG